MCEPDGVFPNTEFTAALLDPDHSLLPSSQQITVRSPWSPQLDGAVFFYSAVCVIPFCSFVFGSLREAYTIFCGRSKPANVMQAF